MRYRRSRRTVWKKRGAKSWKRRKGKRIRGYGNSRGGIRL